MSDRNVVCGPSDGCWRREPASLHCSHSIEVFRGPVAELVGIRVGVVSGVINLESSGVEASDWRLRHEATYHEAGLPAACDRAGC
jgi:hypothetical protein